MTQEMRKEIESSTGEVPPELYATFDKLVYNRYEKRGDKLVLTDEKFKRLSTKQLAQEKYIKMIDDVENENIRVIFDMEDKMFIFLEKTE